MYLTPSGGAPVAAPDHRADADHSVDRVVDWLLDGLQWSASVFHVGQYCGRWRASTAGRASASFHLVLEGRCWLHLPGSAPVALMPRDGVFLMRDVPHFLSPYADSRIECAEQRMQPLQTTGALGETGLACGFFSVEGPLRDLIVRAFPECLVLRAGDSAMGSAGALFDLMQVEARRAGTEPSVVMDRLAGLLFFYALRHIAQHDPQALGLLALLRRRNFASLIGRLLAAPAQRWTVQDMADHVHLSRAAFFRQFAEACAQSPLQFLLLMRMQLAARRLAQGESISRTAAAVGYESYAAFSRAFKRAFGDQPGAWQKSHTRDVRHE